MFSTDHIEIQRGRLHTMSNITVQSVHHMWMFVYVFESVQQNNKQSRRPPTHFGGSSQLGACANCPRVHAFSKLTTSMSTPHSWRPFMRLCDPCEWWLLRLRLQVNMRYVCVCVCAADCPTGLHAQKCKETEWCERKVSLRKTCAKDACFI